MTYLLTLAQSRTIWTLVLIAVLGGVQALQPFMRPELYMLVNGLLLALAGYFRVDARAKF